MKMNNAKKTFYFLLLILFVPNLLKAKEVDSVMNVEDQCLFGGTIDKKWTPAADIQTHLTKTKYKIFSQNGFLKEVECKLPALKGEDIGPDYYFECPTLKNEDLERNYIATTANYSLTPRPVHEKKGDRKLYEASVKAQLLKNGIKNPKVKIEQVIEVDLEGDGVNEVFISASSYINSKVKNDEASSLMSSHMRPAAGDYSLILMRKNLGAKVEEKVLIGDFFPKALNDYTATHFSIAGFYDVDGDGVYEMFVSDSYYEGYFVSIHRIKNMKMDEGIGTCGAGA